jgi:hypothetical protein
MKKATLVCVVFFSLAAVLFWVALRPPRDAPRFEKIASTNLPPHRSFHFDFLAQRPFQNDRMWIHVIFSRNDYACFLYDIERRRIVGQLHNADPVFSSGDGTRLLCKSWSRSFKTTCAELLGKALGKTPGSFAPGTHAEKFWVLDIPSNSAKPIGRAKQWQGSGSRIAASPDWRFGITQPTAGENTLVVWDLESRSQKEMRVAAYAAGWWDDKHIAMQNTKTTNFILLNVMTGQTAPLLYYSNIIADLDSNRVDHAGHNPGLFSSWNGRGFEFYVTDTHKRWEATNSFLIHVERPDARLRLIAPRFKFGWSDHFDEQQRLYVFSGRDPGDRTDGVFLRDMQSGLERTLVPPNNAAYFSIPLFYRDSVIYTTNRELWRIDGNGSNNTRLFPPPLTN